MSAVIKLNLILDSDPDRFYRLAERAGMLMDAGMDFETATKRALEQEWPE